MATATKFIVSACRLLIMTLISLTKTRNPSVKPSASMLTEFHHNTAHNKTCFGSDSLAESAKIGAFHAISVVGSYHRAESTDFRRVMSSAETTAERKRISNSLSAIVSVRPIVCTCTIRTHFSLTVSLTIRRHISRAESISDNQTFGSTFSICEISPFS